MSTEHDLEYGPNPPGAQYEHTDIDVSLGYNFAIWLFVAMLLSIGIVYGAFALFESQKVKSDIAAQQFPLVALQRRAARLATDLADGQIAAIARLHGATVATRNIADFAHSGIRLIDPWATRP